MMLYRQQKLTIAFALTLFLAACGTTGGPISSPMATGTPMPEAQQCVPYARQVSGIQIFGDAYTWWDQAAYGYGRGAMPKLGSVLVLPRTRKMTHGHLAVVKDVISPREINVTHSNWGDDRQSRRVLYHSMRVEDVSPNNTWTRVRFWNAELNCFGLPYAAKGFIYR